MNGPVNMPDLGGGNIEAAFKIFEFLTNPKAVGPALKELKDAYDKTRKERIAVEKRTKEARAAIEDAEAATAKATEARAAAEKLSTTAKLEMATLEERKAEHSKTARAKVAELKALAEDLGTKQKRIVKELEDAERHNRAATKLHSTNLAKEQKLTTMLADFQGQFDAAKVATVPAAPAAEGQ